MCVCVRVCVCVCAAVVFDTTTCKLWIMSSMIAFLLDALVYHSVALALKASAQFLMLVALGTDNSTLPRTTGKVAEQVRWFCTDFYQ